MEALLITTIDLFVSSLRAADEEIVKPRDSPLSQPIHHLTEGTRKGQGGDRERRMRCLGLRGGGGQGEGKREGWGTGIEGERGEKGMGNRKRQGEGTGKRGGGAGGIKYGWRKSCSAVAAVGLGPLISRGTTTEKTKNKNYRTSK